MKTNVFKIITLFHGKNEKVSPSGFKRFIIATLIYSIQNLSPKELIYTGNRKK